MRLPPSVYTFGATAPAAPPIWISDRRRKIAMRRENRQPEAGISGWSGCMTALDRRSVYRRRREWYRSKRCFACEYRFRRRRCSKTAVWRRRFGEVPLRQMDGSIRH